MGVIAEGGMERRDFLKLGALSGTAVLASAALPGVSLGALQSVTLDEIMKMTPQQMARKSRIVMDAWRYLQTASVSLRNRNIRSIVTAILDNPVPTFAERLQDAATKQSVWEELTAAGYLSIPIEQFLPPTPNPKKSVQPFYSAPGSGYQSHHSYPGGLVTHTALNLRVSLALFEGYGIVNDTAISRDVVVASQMLHDLCKPWVFQWQPNGDSRTELSLAATGEHHTYSIAESIQRGLPAAVCVAQACAHNHPGATADEAQVVGWIKAACMLLGVDPVAKGLLSPTGDTLPAPRAIEDFVCHLGDHDWVLSVPAAGWIIAEMKSIATDVYGMTAEELQGAKFFAFRNYVFSQATILHLYRIFSTKGKEGLTDKVTSMVTPG